MCSSSSACTVVQTTCHIFFSPCILLSSITEQLKSAAVVCWGIGVTFQCIWSLAKLANKKERCGPTVLAGIIKSLWYRPKLLLSGVKLLLLLLSPTSLCVGEFHNTFQTLQIHVKTPLIVYYWPLTPVRQRERKKLRVCHCTASMLFVE